LSFSFVAVNAILTKRKNRRRVAACSSKTQVRQNKIQVKLDFCISSASFTFEEIHQRKP